MFELLASAAVVGSACVIVRAWIKRHKERLRNLHFHRGHFFQLAYAVLNEETDERLLLRLKTAVDTFDHPKSFGRLEAAVTAVEADLRAGRLAARKLPNTPPEWSDLMWHYFMAISYTRAVRGTLLRNRMAALMIPQSERRNADAIDRRILSSAAQVVHA